MYTRTLNEHVFSCNCTRMYVPTEGEVEIDVMTKNQRHKERGWTTDGSTWQEVSARHRGEKGK